MKLTLRKSLILLMATHNCFINASQITLASNDSRNLWQPRAFSSYSLNNALLIKDIAIYDDQTDSVYNSCSAVTEYMKSYGGDGSGLGSTPFWSGTNSMTTGTNNGESDVDIYQFGMGEALTQGTISLQPKVQQFGIELFYYYQQNKQGPGFIAKIYLPIGGININAQLSENPAELNLTDDQVWLEYPAGSNRYPTLTSAFNGGICNDTDAVVSSVNKPIALNSGRISPSTLTAIGFADVSIVLGVNAINKENGFLMIGAKATLPTNNIPHARYILEPLFGRAGHLGLGVELSAAYKLYQYKGTTIDLYVQAEALHLFSFRQPSWRSFDLKQNGPGSKYLLTQFYFPGNTDLTATPANPTGRIPSFITQAVNITTMPVFSSFAIEGSCAFFIDIRRANYSNLAIGLGIEIWGRTQENLTINNTNVLNYDRVNLNDYAILGRQISENALTGEVLTLCEPLAKINLSQDRVIDSTAPYDTDLIKDARVSANRIPSNISDALDITGACQPASISGKALLSGTYTWKENYNIPALTIFGATEFANSSMINFWSIGVLGSINF